MAGLYVLKNNPFAIIRRSETTNRAGPDETTNRVATVREKYLEKEIFSTSGNFVDGQGN